MKWWHRIFVRRREKILEELLATEEKYVDDLQSVLTGYRFHKKKHYQTNRIILSSWTLARFCCPHSLQILKLVTISVFKLIIGEIYRVIVFDHFKSSYFSQFSFKDNISTIIFRDRMESSPSLAGQKCPIIFGNLEDIYQFHSQCLLPELERWPSCSLSSPSPSLSIPLSLSLWSSFNYEGAERTQWT